jgi:hypothetical protein
MNPKKKRKLMLRKVSFEETIDNKFWFMSTLMCEGYICCDYRFELNKDDFNKNWLELRELKLQYEALCKSHPNEKEWQEHLLRKIKELQKENG